MREKEVSLKQGKGKSDKKVRVRELNVFEIRTVLESLGQLGSSEMTPLELLDRFTSEFVPMGTELTPEQFMELTPSEIFEIWEAFKEVNSHFFDLVRKTGILEGLDLTMPTPPIEPPSSSKRSTKEPSSS